MIRDIHHSIEVDTDFVGAVGCDVWVEDSDGFYDTFVMSDARVVGDDVMEDGNGADHFQEQGPTVDFLRSISSFPPETFHAILTSKSCPCELFSKDK